MNMVGVCLHVVTNRSPSIFLLKALYMDDTLIV